MTSQSRQRQRPRRDAAVRTRDEALVRIRRVTVATGLTATVAAVGIGLVVAQQPAHSATAAITATSSTSGSTAATTSPTASASTPSTTPTTTTTPVATTTSGQS